MRVLIVEDDVDLAASIVAGLNAGGLAADHAPDWPQADLKLSVNTYDAMVLDHILPLGDALLYLARRRAAGCTLPALILTARDWVVCRPAGFAVGADDYLVKPFAMAELVTRVRALCRREAATAPPVLRCGNLTIDMAAQQVLRGGMPLPLTPKERAVLALLVSRAGTVVSRSDLVEGCWDEMAQLNSNVVDVVVGNLRRKLGSPPLVHTVRGLGYLATADPVVAQLRRTSRGPVAVGR